MTIFHIDADAFFAAVEQGFNLRLRGRAVIVGGTENQRGVVHTASYEARAQGVRTGMSLSAARRICPQAVFLKGNYHHYQAASRTMQEIYLRYTPAVEFTSLDDAYLDFRGTERLYGDREALARQIQADVERALGVGVSIGIGSSKLIARIASGLRKPRGIVRVPPGSERDFLHRLPVEVLPGIGRITRERLAELNIFTVGELARLPRLVLNQVFGRNGAKMGDFAHGIDPREVRQRILPKQISRETTFEEDLTDPLIIRATLQYLAERIAAKLRHSGQQCRQVGIKIRYSDFKQEEMQQRFAAATDSATAIFDAVAHLFSRLTLRRMRIRQVGVKAGKIEWKMAQLAFMDEEQRRKLLDAVIDEIRERYGFTAILPADTLALQGQYRMEKSGYVLHSPALTR